MMELLDDIGSQLFFLIVALMLAFSIYQTVGTGLGTDTPIVSVVSNSMAPTFQRGDMIVVTGTSFEQVEEGDIIVYRSKYPIINANRPPLIHRVVNKTNNSLETMGDANEEQVRYCIWDNGFRMTSNGCPADAKLVNAETNITEQQLVGEVLFIMPFIGNLKLMPACWFYKLQYPDSHPQVQYTC
ncbi:MAG: signal peptidase I [Candidatus Nanohaloarchaea archaeon]|nr:signal peptidase I [Candidatus Nanohaloarchaea archaeon]